MRRKPRQSVSIVRLLREQQDILEENLEPIREEQKRTHQFYMNIIARLDTLEKSMPDVRQAVMDLGYLTGFCEQFWSRDGASPMEDGEEMPLPKSAKEIIPNVPERKKSEFGMFVERLQELILHRKG